MHPSATPQLGPAGPYHQMPPQMPYHNEQVPTTSHPSWHQGAYPGLPTPPYQAYPHQQHPNYMPPLTQQVQQRSAYSSPSPSIIAPSAPPPQNKNLRTEQWVQQWPYAQSPAPSVAPSVMSYHQNDDRMSMLSVNTAIQYPDAQRCFSSNGSTCENVNPEVAKIGWAPLADQAMREWFSVVDPNRKFSMAMTIREWVRKDKFSNLEPARLQDYIQHLLTIIHDGMKPQRTQLPPSYYTQLYCCLLDVLLRITSYPITLPYMNLVVQLFLPKENGPQDFRALLLNLLRPDCQKDEHLQHCTTTAFRILDCVLHHVNNAKHEQMRMDFNRAIKFDGMFQVLLEYFHPQLPPNLINPVVMLLLRFIISKDAVLKDRLIWGPDPQREHFTQTSIVMAIRGVLLKCHHAMTCHPPDPARQNVELQRIIQVVTRTFDLLNLLIHDSNAIDGFVRSDGINLVCTVVNYPNLEVARAGFKLLLHVSDARALSTINLKEILPFIIQRVRENVRNTESRRLEEDHVVYCGTGFLSNAVANQQHVKELAIANDSIGLLYEVVMKYTPLPELRDTLRRNPVCEIISNSLRTLNNFLMMWIPIQGRQMTEAPGNVRQQVCRFIEMDVLKRLMTCLSIEGIDIPPMMELRSTILRLFLLLLRTPFIPKEGLLNVTDDARKKNIVEHICRAFAWAMAQPVTERTRDTRHQLVERVFNLLVRLIEQCGAATEVALSFYAVNCPLSLLGSDQARPMFVLNVLLVCDQILMHNPSVANVWSVDRPLLEVLKNHSNSDIERAASSVLSKLPDVDPLAAILSNC